MRVKTQCNISVSVPWISVDHWLDVIEWLLNNGPKIGDYKFSGVDMSNYENRIFNFKYKEDAVLFALKWS